MIRLLICDKDGTLVMPSSGSGFIQHPEDQILIPGAAEAIAHYHQEGWSIVIASNQGGCSAKDPKTGNPYKSLEDAIKEMKYCMGLLPQINLGLFCPDSGRICYRVRRHHLNEGSSVPYSSNIEAYGSFRKPAPGMLNFAVGYDLRPSDGQDIWAEVKRNSLFVGDRPEDEGAAAAAGVPFMRAEEWHKL